MPNNKITAMIEVLSNNELEVLNDAMRLGKVRPFGRQRQAAKRLCKKDIMVELVSCYFAATLKGQEIFKNTTVKQK